MTKREDARKAREAIARLSQCDLRDPRVVDGLRLAAILHHYLPLDLWTQRELARVLKQAGLAEYACELEAPPQLKPTDVFEGLPEETLEPRPGWIARILARFG